MKKEIVSIWAKQEGQTIMQVLKTMRYAGIIALLIGLLLGLFPTTSYAFNTMTVQVTINSVKNRGHCWDENYGLWCGGKPDYFVIVYGTGNGQQVPPCQTSVEKDLDNVDPAPSAWTCSFQVDRPGEIFVSVYDADGPDNDPTHQAEQADVDPGGAKATNVNLETIGTGVPVTYNRAGDDTEISFTVTATVDPGKLNSFTASATSFRPSAGEQITLMVSTTGAPVLRFRAFDAAGTEVWNAIAYVQDTHSTTQMVWQGRDASGKPLLPGSYKLVVEGSDPHPNSATLRTNPPSLSAMVNIQPPPPVASLTVLSVYPSPQWAPETGVLTIRVASSATASISADVFQWGTCSGQAIGAINAVTVQPAVLTDLTWNGMLFGNMHIPPGQYSIRVSGFANGSPTNPAFICRPIEVIVAPKALLYMQHFPFLPEPGQTVELKAVSVDPSGAPRIVARLDVWGFTYPLGPGTPPPTPTAPLRSCERVSTCTAVIKLPSTSAHLSWKADAADINGGVMSTSGWRGQHVTKAATFAQMTDFAFPTDVALNGPTAAQSRDLAYSFDLVMSVSTDFDWTRPADRQTIGEALDRFMTRLWGLSGPGGPAPSTFLSRPDLVRLYLIPERRVVTWTPPANECEWSVPDVPWADAKGILHKVDCRDNADPFDHAFSAKLHSEDAIFHELHHALFGLADEYCGPCDGGYSAAGPFPNVYDDLNACSAVPGREIGGCSSIVEVDINTGQPTGKVFYRLDTSWDDVMDRNGRQRFGDMRQATWKESECDNGRC